ncbi:hypothetical protein Tco_0366083 [Tanacetum coccineum]
MKVILCHRCLPEFSTIRTYAAAQQIKAIHNSASAEDIEVQSYFLDDQLTNLSPPRNCMPPDVLLREIDTAL